MGKHKKGEPKDAAIEAKVKEAEEALKPEPTNRPQDFMKDLEESKKKTYRSIRFKSDIKTLIARTELGFDLVFELQPQIRVNPYELSKKNTPEFQAQIAWVMKGVRPRGNAMKLSEIKDIVLSRSVVPMELPFDIIQLGFVYSNVKDPNNHKWWVESLKKTEGLNYESVFSEYSLYLKSDAPFATRSWFDGIYHGRFTFAKSFIKEIMEDTPGRLFIKGNGEGKLGDLVEPLKPVGYTKLRLRYDIRRDLWFGEFLDATDTLIGKPLVSKYIRGDAKFEGYVMSNPKNPTRPYVSGIIREENVDMISIDNQTLMIKGK